MPRRSEEYLLALMEDLQEGFELIFANLDAFDHEREKFLHPSRLRICANALLKEKKFSLEGLNVDFHLLTLPELSGGEFPFVLYVPRHWNFSRISKDRYRPRRCFVASRFDDNRDRLARLLRRILAYYGYKIEFSDSGFWKGQILDAIIRHLSDEAGDFDFAFFDNRNCEDKPNVYIELGVAYTLDKPLMLFQYGESVIPTDFAGFSTVEYTTYRGLARELRRRLPSFLDDQGILPPWA